MIKKAALLGAVFGAGMLVYSCGGGSGTTSSGTVALYATDDKLEGAGKVEVGIKQVRLENSGTGVSCTVFAPQDPYVVDLTDLQNTLQLLDTTNCPAEQYNRLVVVLEQSPVEVIYNGQAYTCSLATYDPDEDNGNTSPVKPNRTQCDDTAGECTIEVTGAVNILANQTNKVALDFELKDSEINIDNSTNPPTCTVAFKVSPIHAEGFEEHKEKKGKDEEVKGTVSGLNADQNTFTLTTKAGIEVSVSYGNDDYDGLLQLAQDNNLKVEVECSAFDIDTTTCTADEIKLKVEGKVVSEDTATTPTTYGIDVDGDGSADIHVQSNKVEGGTIDVSSEPVVEVEISSCDTANNVCTAGEIEMEMEADEYHDRNT